MECIWWISNLVHDRCRRVLHLVSLQPIGCTCFPPKGIPSSQQSRRIHNPNPPRDAHSDANAYLADGHWCDGIDDDDVTPEPSHFWLVL